MHVQEDQSARPSQRTANTYILSKLSLRQCASNSVHPTACISNCVYLLLCVHSTLCVSPTVCAFNCVDSSMCMQVCAPDCVQGVNVCMRVCACACKCMHLIENEISDLFLCFDCSGSIPVCWYDTHAYAHTCIDTHIYHTTFINAISAPPPELKTTEEETHVRYPQLCVCNVCRCIHSCVCACMRSAYSERVHSHQETEAARPLQAPSMHKSTSFCMHTPILHGHHNAST